MHCLKISADYIKLFLSSLYEYINVFTIFHKCIHNIFKLLKILVLRLSFDSRLLGSIKPFSFALPRI